MPAGAVSAMIVEWMATTIGRLGPAAAIARTTSPTCSSSRTITFRYKDLSKEALVRLVREFALIAQLLDRSVFAAIGLRYGQRAVEELAIEEWRGASPIYTERIRKIMNIEGNEVPAIFKQLQLDPGFAQHYMDVEYQVVDENHGFFQLRSCGALLAVEPWGERPVRGMCHTIEDGTARITRGTTAATFEFPPMRDGTPHIPPLT
jgi:hypothetical protein